MLSPCARFKLRAIVLPISIALLSLKRVIISSVKLSHKGALIAKSDQITPRTTAPIVTLFADTNTCDSICGVAAIIFGFCAI